MSRNDPAGRANRPCWLTGFGVPGQRAVRRSASIAGWLVGVHRVQVEVAKSDALFLRDGEGCR